MTIEHPTQRGHHAYEDAEKQSDALRRIHVEYDPHIEDADTLARLSVNEIVGLSHESEAFEAINIKQLLGSDHPQSLTDIPRFEHYYNLARDYKRIGERIIWFGQTALSVFNKEGCAKKVAMELGHKNLYGQDEGMRELYDFELAALDRTIGYDPHTFIHKINPFDSSRYHPVTLRPTYSNGNREHPSPHFISMRAREAVADIYPSKLPGIEIFRATHWMIVLNLVEPDLRNKLRGSVMDSHDVETARSAEDSTQTKPPAYTPQYAEELFAAAYAKKDSPDAFVPLVTRSLAMIRRPAEGYFA